MACPITARTRASQSMTAPRFNAARIPNGTASAIANTRPATPSLNVFSARSPIASIAGVPPAARQEVPKSPCARFQRKLPYWTISGSFSPRVSLKRSMSAPLASSGNRAPSGLPTVRETKKTIVTTRKTTKNAWTSRIAK